MPFYVDVGVSELWIIPRDTCRPELYVLRAGQYERQSPNNDRWLHSSVTGIEMHGASPAKLDLRIAGNDETGRSLLKTSEKNHT